MKPLAIDLFCGAGGAGAGLMQAGFNVIGVDILPQRRYPSAFIRADALRDTQVDRLIRMADLVWASPPCQASTALRHMHNAKKHVDLIPSTRAVLRLFGTPYVIENVMGADLINPVVLDGTMFGLQTPCGAALIRARQFEASFPLSLPIPLPDPSNKPDRVIGIYGGHFRNRKRKGGMNRQEPDFTAADGKAAMGISWMTVEELSQAIPPAYSEYIGRQFLAQTRAVAA